MPILIIPLITVCRKSWSLKPVSFVLFLIRLATPPKWDNGELSLFGDRKTYSLFTVKGCRFSRTSMAISDRGTKCGFLLFVSSIGIFQRAVSLSISANFISDDSSHSYQQINRMFSMLCFYTHSIVCA